MVSIVLIPPQPYFIISTYVSTYVDKFQLPCYTIGGSSYSVNSYLTTTYCVMVVLFFPQRVGHCIFFDKRDKSQFGNLLMCVYLSVCLNVCAYL